jgi:endonuclease G
MRAAREGFESMSDRASRVAEFVRGLFQTTGLEVLESSPADQKQKYIEATGGSEEVVEAAVNGLHKSLEGEKLTQEEMEGLEAIVLRDQCPTIEVIGDDFQPPKGRWARLKDDRTWLKDVIRAAGRVDCEEILAPYAGSGLLVGSNLVMTNRHVARLFTDGLGLGRSLRRLHPSEFDYKHEKSNPLAVDSVKVEEVLLVHPYWDVALLRVQPTAGRAPLTLAADPPASIEEHEIVVIGYPFFRFAGSEYERAILLDQFGDTPGYKRPSPGG